MTFPPIAIVGRACLLPGAHTPEDLWTLVRAKRFALEPVPDGYWRADRRRMLSQGACATDVGGVITEFEKVWRPEQFPVDPDLLAGLDPLFHWLLHTGREALLDAGIEDTSRMTIGAICGNLAYPTRRLVDFAQSVYLPETCTAGTASVNRFSSGFPVHLLCSALGLRAGGFAIDAACASSLYAIQLASDWLHNRRADVMLAGAVNCCDPLTIYAGFTSLLALSPTGQSRPFHREADGLIPADGAALLVLKRLEDAVAAGDHIHAVIRGIGLSNDGRSSGILAPSSEGQIRAIRAAYTQSGLKPSEISLVECHATGTLVGDATELRSMAAIFENVRDLPIASLKANIGHSITVSGAAGIIRVIEAMKAGVLPATPVAGPLTEALAETPFRLLREEDSWTSEGIRRAAVSSFGFGGNNAHLLLEEYVPQAHYAGALPVPSRQVAVVALAVQAGSGHTTDDFVSDLSRGNHAISERAEQIRLPAESLVFPPRDLEKALPQQIGLLSAAAEALPGITLPSPERTAVFAGISCAGEASLPVLRLALRDEPIEAATVVGCMPNMAANRISRQFSLTGPSFSVLAEDLSGIRALETGINFLVAGHVDAAVIGAADFSVEPVHIAASRELPGDAACVMVLKRVEDAERDGNHILAILERGHDEVSKSEADIGAQIRKRFGSAHAAQGLLNIAAAIVSIDHNPLPSGIQNSSIIVKEPGALRRGNITHDAPRLFIYSGRTLNDLRHALDHPSNDSGDWRLAIVAAEDEFAQRIAAAKLFLDQYPDQSPPPDGIFFRQKKLSGEIAWVFTGAAAAYPEMGRDLMLAFPELVRDTAQQFDIDLRRYAGWVYSESATPSDFDQLCGSSFLCQLHARFTSDVLRLKPHAAIGLSSGETNALFALGAWREMGAFLREIEECGLYTRVLAGSADALGGKRWAHYRIFAPQNEIAEAIRGEPSVFITIVNAPDDVLIGGDASACERVVRRFGPRATPLALELAVHCPAVEPAAHLWHTLHSRSTAQPSGIRFYSNATNDSYILSTESVAGALTRQAVNTVDFPRTIRKAWDDGVRIFVEHGPRNQCTQSIHAILADRPHLAVSLDVNGRSSLHQALSAAAELWCAGVPVDIAGLCTRLDAVRAPRPWRGPTLEFPAHPAPPRHDDQKAFVMEPAPKLAPLLEPVRIPSFATAPLSPIDRTVLAMHARMTEAHQLHLAELTRIQESFLAAESRLLTLLTPGEALPHGNGSRHRSFSRSDLEKMSSGRISDLFGDSFRAQDAFRRQVRMPAPPLLLADRVVEIIGEPHSMGLGSIVTETDVTPSAWYLHQGYMPAGIAVECGQADLLLISWLGIDRFNEGERVYRLLGCDLTFHGDLPRAGDRLRYAIHIDGHTAHGDVRMFSFHSDCTSNGKPVLTVRQGTAGFFTDRELADSEGVLWSPESLTSTPGTTIRLEEGRAVTTRRVFTASQVQAFAAGRLAECFGEGFERALSHTRSPRIQSERMLLIRTVEQFDPAGSPAGRGYLRAEYPVSADDWFFKGHFKDDPCMPGTLMFEGCLQAMAFYMSALGFTLERDGWRFAPVSGETYTLRCRGQVTPSSKRLSYEVFVDEIASGPEPRLYAHVLASVDGLKAFHCRLGLRLVPDWPLEEVQPHASANIPFDQQSLMACALGRPSHAFGEEFRKFDGPVRTPRLPGPPYHFMSRVVQANKTGQVEGSIAEAEYDVNPGDWYFAEGGDTRASMPISVLIEILLQPCGWLASFAGTWLNAREDVFFRNLDGSGVFHAEVFRDSGTLRTRVTLTSCSRAGAMTITAFRIACFAGAQLIFEGSAVFGHFPAEALRNQPGLAPSADELKWISAPGATSTVPLRGRKRLQMIDRVTGWWPEAGCAGLGVLRVEKDVDPQEWFFKAHFFSDPVQPGSLGLEAITETLKMYFLLAGLQGGIVSPQFEPIGVGMPVTWTYRGQVLPHNRRVTVLLEVLDLTRQAACLSVRAAASLWVDGTKIYSIAECGMRLRQTETPAAEEFLDPSVDEWLLDHCPTYTVPVLPMMSVVDRLAQAAARTMPDRRVVEIRDVQLNGWIAFDRGGRSFRTEAVAVDRDTVDAQLLVWREAPRREMSRYDAMATARVRLADCYPAPPDTIAPLIGATLAHDPPAFDLYETGELFHGPRFHFLKKLWRGPVGSSFELDAAVAGTPRGFLDQALFDGIAHGIPNENPGLWSDRIPDNQVGYPARVRRLSLFAEPPADRRSGCEVRFDGFENGESRFPQFRAQLIHDGRVWAEIELVYALFSKGQLGRAPGPQRRKFLQQQIYVPGMILGQQSAETTCVRATDLNECDWMPGGIDRAFGLQGGNRLLLFAIKQHIARIAAVHPATVNVSADFRSAKCARFPLTVFPVTIESINDSVTVRNDGSARLDCESVRSFWSRTSGTADWPIADLHIALIERFVRRVEFDDPAGFANLRGRSVMYLANHQVALESVIFNVILSALSEVPIRVIAKKEHRESWIGRLIELASRYPGARQPDPILFFDRSDPASFFALLGQFRAAMNAAPASLMAHVDGTRATSSRQRTNKVSAALLDFAIREDLPVVPVRFIGGLPGEPVPARLDFPFAFGQQDIRIGAAIPAGHLCELTLAERSALVADAINRLAPEDEAPLPPHPQYPLLEAAVLLESLRYAHHIGREASEVLDAAEGNLQSLLAGEKREWMEAFAVFLRETRWQR